MRRAKALCPVRYYSGAEIADQFLEQQGDKMSDGPYLTMTFVDPEGDARMVNLEYRGADAPVHFERYRHLNIEDKQRFTFLFDLHDVNGDLVDTICLDDAGFEVVTGKKPEPPEHYIKFDQEYWAAIWEEHEAGKRKDAEKKKRKTRKA